MSFVDPETVSVNLSPVFTSRGLCAFMRAMPVTETLEKTTSIADIFAAQPHLAGRLMDLFVAQLVDHQKDSRLPVSVSLPHIGSQDATWVSIFERLSTSPTPFVLELDGAMMLTSPVESAALIATAREYGLSVYAQAETTADMHAFSLLGAAGIVAGDLVFTAKPIVM